MHDISLITTISFGLTAALICGLIAKRLGMSPIVGYLLAGIAIGPFTPGFVGDVHLAKQLAEIGVILLMFGVGLHFHLHELVAVRSIAVPGAIGQSVAATVCGLAVTTAAGWTWNAGLVLGIAISVASTVVLLRVLMDHGLVETTEGRVAVGWLVVEDIFTVIVLVLLPALAIDGASSPLQILSSAGIAVTKLAVLGAIMAVAGVRFVPWLLLRVSRLRSRELFTLTVLVIAMAVATIGYLAFGASMALGAFLAGMVVSQSKVSHQAAADALPMRDAFAVLFFVSVGMLFDWREVFREPWLVLGLLGVIILVKPAIAILIVLWRRHSLKTAMTVAGGLSQIGEFSFIVAEAARTLKILPEAGQHALVGSAILSISLNPWLFGRFLALEKWVQGSPRLRRWFDERSRVLGKSANSAVTTSHSETVGPHAIIVGYGPVGQLVQRRARDMGLDPLVIDMNIDTVVAIQAEKMRALYGDAARAEILTEAQVKSAACLIVTIPDVVAAVSIVTAARALNPQLKILARVRYSNQAPLVEQAGADAVCNDEAESATVFSILLKAHVRQRLPEGSLNPSGGEEG